MYLEDIEAREKFLTILEWLLFVIKRYPTPIQFGLAHIRYASPKILGETYGAQQASQQLDDISHSMRKAFRTTDLVARNGSDFWILLPYAPNQGKLANKKAHIIYVAAQNGLHIAENDISIFALPQDEAKVSRDYSALELLACLKENFNTLAHHEMPAPARLTCVS